MKSSQVKFNTNALKKVLLKNLSKEQTARFIDYAQREIRLLGDMIQTYHSRHHMDRTGNLLNSLCWGVCHNGKLIEYGFYREAVLHNGGRYGTSESWLHEFFQEADESINGRELAENYIKSQKKSGIPNGWRVFFAILAPYWGYWESGFTMKSNFGKGAARHMQFQVMTHLFDDVRMDLKPAETHLSVYVPSYQYRNRKYKGKVGTRRYALNQKWHK